MKTLMLQLAFIATLFGVSAFAQPARAVSASDLTSQACQQDPSLPGCEKKDPARLASGKNNLVATIINTLLYAAGIASFIFVIIGGIRYITSTGDGPRVQSAKDTLLYAIIGLIVTALAIPISSFVIGNL